MGREVQIPSIKRAADLAAVTGPELFPILRLTLSVEVRDNTNVLGRRQIEVSVGKQSRFAGCPFSTIGGERRSTERRRVAQ